MVPLFQFPSITTSSPFSENPLILLALSNSPLIRSPSHRLSFRKRTTTTNRCFIFPCISPRSSSLKARCVAESTEERWNDGETLVTSDSDEWSDDIKIEDENNSDRVVVPPKKSSSDSLSLGIREPVYEVKLLIIL